MPQPDLAAGGLAYRRGTLFGFTLAEIVLLVIFALLLSVAALLIEKDRRIRDLEKKSTNLEQRAGSGVWLSAEDARLVEALKRAYRSAGRPEPKPDDLFRELRLLKDAAELPRLQAQLSELRSQLAEKAKHDLPPIITLQTSNYFRLGEAKLVPEFRARLLSQIIPELLELGRRYDVEVIEIVGHTDELPIANTRSNLDLALLPYLNNKAAEGDLIAADNAGLGLSRAAAVSQVLSQDGRLRRFRILPLSAGQVIDSNQSISQGANAADVEGRRRIEIRMRRLQ